MAMLVLLFACLLLAPFTCSATVVVTEGVPRRTSPLGLTMLAKQHPVRIVSTFAQQQQRQLFFKRIRKAVKKVGKIAKSAGKLAKKVANNKFVKMGVVLAGALGCTVATGGACAAVIAKAKAVAAKSKAGALALKGAKVAAKGYKMYKKGKAVVDKAKVGIAAVNACRKKRDKDCLNKLKSAGMEIAKSAGAKKLMGKLGSTSIGGKIAGTIKKHQGTIKKIGKVAGQVQTGVKHAKTGIDAYKACKGKDKKLCLEKLKGVASQVAQSKGGKKALGKFANTKTGGKVLGAVQKHKGKIKTVASVAKQTQGAIEAIKACSKSQDKNCLEKLKGAGAQFAQSAEGKSLMAKFAKSKSGGKVLNTIKKNEGKIKKVRSGINQARDAVEAIKACSKSQDKNCLEKLKGAGTKFAQSAEGKSLMAKFAKTKSGGKVLNTIKKNEGKIKTIQKFAGQARATADMIKACKQSQDKNCLDKLMKSGSQLASLAKTLPLPGAAQKVSQLMSQSGVSADQVRTVFGYVRDTYNGDRKSLLNAVTQVKVSIENKAANLAGGAVDKVTSNTWAARQMQRFNIDPTSFNAIASDAVRKAVGYGLESLQDAAMNTEAGRKISLIDSGIQGALTMESSALGCDGQNGCVVSDVRILQSANGRLDLTFNAQFSPDAINAAASGFGASFSRDQIATAITAVLSDNSSVQRAINAAALESTDAAIRTDLGTCQVTSALSAPPVFFQTPITGWDTLMAAGKTSQPTPRPSPRSAFFVPCSTNCPTSNVPLCGFFQTCGNGCFCGTAPGVPSPFPTRQPTVNSFVISQPVATRSRVVSPAPSPRLRTSAPTPRAPAPAPAPAPAQGPAPAPILGAGAAAGVGTVPPTPGRPTLAPTLSPTLSPTQAPTQAPQAQGASSTGGGASASKGTGGMDNGTIAGVVVACAVIVALIAGLLFCSKNGKEDRLTPADMLKALSMGNYAHGNSHSSSSSNEAGLFAARSSVAMAGRPSSRGSDFDHSSVYSGRGSASFQPYIAPHRDSMRRPSMGFGPQPHGPASHFARQPNAARREY